MEISFIGDPAIQVKQVVQTLQQTTNNSSPSVGARAVKSGWVGLYGRRRGGDGQAVHRRSRCLDNPQRTPAVPLTDDAQLHDPINNHVPDITCRGKGGVDWKGGPLWSPAVSLNDEASRHIAIDKGVKHADTD